MKKWFILMAATGGTFGLSGMPVYAAQVSEECQASIDGYSAAIDEIDSLLRKYVRCISNSEGEDDCSTEFRRLRSAQSDFESAVSEYQSECR
jgi:hypothetical protein